MQLAERSSTTVLTGVILPRRRRRFSLTGKLAVAILLLIGLAALFGPQIWQQDALEQNIAVRLQNPSWEHPFGTDQFGRDTFARLLLGARWSLIGALVVCLGTSLLGFTIGAVAASSPPLVDNVIGRTVEAFMALPGIVMALAFTAVLGASFPNLLLALIITNWPWYARTYRALIIKERVAPYNEGAVAIGVSAWQRLARHILPNIIGPALIIATTNFGAVILNLSALSFIGLGMQPPTPEWGTLINEARAYFQRFPWQMLAPGLCIALTVLSMNLLGDALRDWLDPRTRYRR